MIKMTKVKVIVGKRVVVIMMIIVTGRLSALIFFSKVYFAKCTMCIMLVRFPNHYF